MFSRLCHDVASTPSSRPQAVAPRPLWRLPPPAFVASSPSSSRLQAVAPVPCGGCPRRPLSLALTRPFEKLPMPVLILQARGVASRLRHCLGLLRSYPRRPGGLRANNDISGIFVGLKFDLK